MPLDEALGRQVAAAGLPLTVVSLGSPYVLRRFEGAQAPVCSYSACVVLYVGGVAGLQRRHTEREWSRFGHWPDGATRGRR